MEGDLSLSQSFGGLRIANPDDSSTSTAQESVSPLQAASSERVTVENGVSSSNQASRNGRNSIATAANTQGPQTYQLSRHSPSVNHNRNFEPPKPSSRPKSAYFVPPNRSSSQVQPGSYRFHAESSSQVLDFSKKGDPRGSSTAIQAGVPIRDENHTERAYSKPAQPAQGYAGSAPLPPRQSSRRMLNHAPQSHPGASFNLENAPPHGSDEWQERGAAVGMRQEIDANGNPISRLVKKGVRDFSFGRTLGEGSYSTVVAATDRQTLKEYAIKILDKRHIIKEKKVKYVNIEKDTLNRLTDHPGVVRLYYTFQDERSLYFVLDLAVGGELLGVLKRMGTFDEECTKFYGAQILDTVGYMHRRGVIHRDLKPENVLLDSQMHVKITDFGTAKMLKIPSQKDASSSGMPPLDTSEDERASSFVGTAEYVSPELLTNKSACKASDLWAFGCIIYQLLAGRPPFKAGNEYQTFQKIVGLEYTFPRGFPPLARDLVERLLVPDPASRLQIEHIKNHEFFDGISWGRDLWSQKPPRLNPYVPPPPDPIQLNDTEDSYPPNISKKPATNFSSNPPQTRSYHPVVAELPPPSQLDIEWSPVLTRTNERILKLGNLMVSSSSVTRSRNGSGNGEHESSHKLSRFFGGAAHKKRQRLVLVTSAGRVIIVPAGGEDKRAKLDISLLHDSTTYRSITDMKGNSSWVVDTNDKHFVFEEGKHPSSGEIEPSAVTMQEWLDALDRAKEMGNYYADSNEVYLDDDGLRDISSGVSSHANTLNHADEFSNHPQHPQNSGRAALAKQPVVPDGDPSKGRKRFSRHSKNGLSAVF